LTAVSCLFAVVALSSRPAVSSAEEGTRLREQFGPGTEYHVSCRVELSGSLALPAERGQPAPKPLPITGTSAIEYDERVLSLAADGQVQKTARIYRRVDFERKVGDQPQKSTIRPAVRRLIILRLKQKEVPFSPDGPLMWGEIDVVRTDVFTPALAGLLPDTAVRPGERWTAANAAVEELTDLERIEEGRLECRFEEITTLSGRQHARVSFAGTVRGVNEDGPNRQQLDGYFYFDLQSGSLNYLSLKGIHSLLDKDGKEAGRIEGRFVLTRQTNTRSREVSDEALRGLALEPNAENTLLLYDNPDLGVRLLHPRRWRVAGVRGRQLALDEANGSGLLFTVEPPAKVPTAAQFLTESKNYLQQQKAKLLRIDPPRRVQAAPQELEQFAIEAEAANQRVLMDYYVVRQAQGGGVLAARLLPTDLAAVRKEVQQIARSIAISRANSEQR
ncbi:MAG TPA: hypothetical protein VKI65_08735, partial [Gemmataceae bacterium]|nr:hypothetical protein [Gemmataceae bacterium]